MQDKIWIKPNSCYWFNAKPGGAITYYHENIVNELRKEIKNLEKIVYSKKETT